MAKESTAGHVPVLDGVRGLAVLMVVFCHLLGPMPDTGILPRIVHHMVAYGALGVDLFFVLSGYLITGILLRSRDDEHYYRNFYARRVLRIFPLYYATLLVLLVIAPGISHRAQQELAPTLPHQGWAWLYVVNFFYLFHPGADLRYLAHFWSLAVEEHFYLAWPLIVRSLSLRALARTCLVAAVASCAARLAAPMAGVDVVATAMVTPLHLDGLCLGALLAVWVFESRAPRFIASAAAITTGAALAIALATVLAQRLDPALRELARTVRGNDARVVIWAGFAGLLASRPASLPRRLFSSTALRFLGKYSYGIYVIHAIVGLALFRAHAIEAVAARVGSLPVAVAGMAAITTAASILMALASYRFLESPFLALKARFAPGTPATATATRPEHPRPAIATSLVAAPVDARAYGPLSAPTTAAWTAPPETTAVRDTSPAGPSGSS